MPFAIATTLVNGSSGVRSFTWDAIRNETIQALADKVEVRDNAEMSARLPEHRPASVKISMNDGAVLEAATETNRGDWRDPYSADELKTKYQDLTARTWRQAEAEAIYDTVMNLEALSSTDELSRLIGQAGGRETD